MTQRVPSNRAMASRLACDVNMIEQAVALAVDGRISLEDVIPPEARNPVVPDAVYTDETLQDVVDRAERAAIESVLREVDGNRERAAERLGLSATTLWRKMKRLALS